MAEDSTSEHRTAAYWAKRSRTLEYGFVIAEVTVYGDRVTLTSDNGRVIDCIREELGRDINIGEHLQLETIGTNITGLADRNGWLFDKSDEDMAALAR